MRTPGVLYPPIQPFRTERLDVGGGHTLYVEQCGNPAGKPVIFLHGGPGSGCSPAHRRLFDPARYCVTLFDQRACGRSTPLGLLEANTTHDLVADIDRVADHFGLGRFMLFGGSWGSTLALAYAKDGASRLFPDEWEHFVAPLSEAERADPIASYHARLDHPDRAVRAQAARSWTDWEARTVSMRTLRDGVGAFGASDAAIAFARIENHFFIHELWLEEGQLIRDAGRLAGIPGIIVQGRYDVVTPPVTAWDLHRAWPGSELQIVEEAGHAFSEPGTLDRLLAATDRYADV